MAGEKAPWHSLRRRCKATGLSPLHTCLQRGAAHTPDTLIQLQRSIRSTFAETTRTPELPARDFSLSRRFRLIEREIFLEGRNLTRTYFQDRSRPRR